MRRGKLHSLAVATTLIGGWSDIGRAGDPVGAGAAPIYTNKAGFRIPYHYDAQEISRLGAREIQLLFSVDRGTNWRHIQSVTPSAGRFEFQAPSDGEYWFSVKTLDSQNRLHPGGTTSAGLMVIVDSQSPRLNIELREREPGKVDLNWTATDPNLAPETLRLEFTQTGQPDWQPVGATPAANGQTSWTVPNGGLVAVRGQVQDRAGNIGRTQFQIQTRGGGAPAVPPAGAVASGFPPPNPLANPIGGNQNNLIPFPPNAMENRVVPPPPQLGANPFASGNPFAGQNLATGIPSPGGFAPNQTGMPRDLATSGTPNPTPTNAGMPFAFGFPAAQGDVTPRFTQVSERGSQRTVNSKRFQLNYRVDDIGPSGVSAVELYITQNDGQKWFRYGIDEDRRSPFEIEVPGDGMYGFIIRVISGAGQADAPPQPGQRPDVVVVVDSTPPTVQLYPLRQGQGRDSNKILVTWQAGDQQLSDKPIALSYSSDPNGPWEPIADWQPNTGSYVWNIGANVPPRLFFRLIARDTAGNFAKVDTPQPVLVDLAKPSARIVDVESAVAPRGAY